MTSLDWRWRLVMYHVHVIFSGRKSRGESFIGLGLAICSDLSWCYLWSCFEFRHWSALGFGVGLALGFGGTGLSLVSVSLLVLAEMVSFSVSVLMVSSACFRTKHKSWIDSFFLHCASNNMIVHSRTHLLERLHISC